MKTFTPLFAILALIGMMAISTNEIMAARGEVTWVNPPENKGVIRDTDTGCEYFFNEDKNKPLPDLEVGTPVNFTPICNGASGICKATDIIIDPTGIPGEDPPDPDTDQKPGHPARSKCE